MIRMVRLMVLMVLALVVFSAAVPVHAQDGGQTPTVVVEDQSNNFDAVWLLALIPGMIAVLAIAAQVIERKNYTQTIQSISADNLNKLEGAIQQVPQSVVTQIHEGNERLMNIVEAALATLKVVDKVTDGKPNEVTSPSMTEAFRTMVEGPAKG